MRRLLDYVLRYRWRYGLGVVCLLLTATAAMSVPYLLKCAVDTVAHGGELGQLSRYAVAIIALAIGQGVVRTFSRALIFNVGRDVEFDLRNDLFAHLQGLPLEFYHRQRTGDLMSRVINDVTAVRMMLGPGILNLVNTPLYYLYGVGMMLTLDPALTVAALVPYPILLWAVKRFSRRLMENTLRVQEGLAALSTAVQENVSGMHVVRAYALEERETERFAAANLAFQRQSMELARARGRLIPVMKTASSVGTLVVLYYGGLRTISGAIGIGDLVAFLAYLNLLAWPTMAMGWMLSVLQRGRAAMQRLDHIFDTVPAIRDGDEPTPLARVHGDIEFREVDFGYDAARNGAGVLHNVSLRIAAGQKVAFVGRTGSGKSTIASLIPRLFDPSSGRILLDGVDLRRMPLSQLRGSVGFVPQDPFLFSTTVRENIAFGVDDASHDDVVAAAAAAGVLADIQSFPRGFDTVVGERGITLSGGQKQRLTLARALLTRPPVLILDDALSSVDTRTERLILESLRSSAAGGTRVMIAHRISTIADADVIVVVERGRIVETGDHSTLVARGGLYAEIFQQQSLEEELDGL